jgi:hypothetical protein
MPYFDLALANQSFVATGASLEKEVAAALPRLRAMSEAAAAKPTAPGKWSPKQILGHLIDLWSVYNRHLAHVIAQMPESLRHVPCVIGDEEPVTLSFIAIDYVGHQQHHLRQIFKEK